MASLVEPPSTEKIPIFEDRSRTFLVTVLVIAVVVGGAVLAAGPIRRLVRVWRAAQIVADGTAALSTNNLPAVSRAVRAALELAPTDPRVQRLAAHYCARTRQAEGISYFELLLKSGQATLGDRQEFVRFCQSLERLDLSGQLLQELISEDAQNRTNQFLVLDQLARLGDWNRVVTGVEALSRGMPNDPELQFLLARAYLGTGNRTNAPHAVTLLRRLIAGGSPQRLAALRTFASLQGVPPQDLELAVTELERAPGALISDRLLAAEVRERLSPSREKDVAAELVNRLSDALDPTDTVAVVEWLRARRRFDLALRLVPLSRARTDSGLTLARGELLADLRQWKDLDAMLRESKLAVHRVGASCLRAVLAYGTGKPDEAAVMLRDAAKAATGNPVFLQQVAIFAAQMGQHALASEIWDGLLRNPATVVPAAAVLLRQSRNDDSLEVERKVYKELIGPLNQQAEVRFQHAYLCALFKEKLTEADSALTTLLSHDITNLRFRAALALTKLRLNLPSEALTLCETGDADWSSQEPRWRVIYAATLHANGQTPAARRIASRIPLDRLKTPERILLDGILDRR